jgi:hypothetical protein
MAAEVNGGSRSLKRVVGPSAPCKHPDAMVCVLIAYHWCHDCGALREIERGKPGKWFIPFRARPNGDMSNAAEKPKA